MIYTPPTQEILNDALKEWNLEAKTNFIGKSESFVYDIEDKDLILRITQNSHRSPDDLNSELSWMDFLYKSGVNLANPILNTKKSFIHSFTFNGESHHAVVFKKAHGKHLKDKEDYTEGILFKWGKLIAETHIATKSSPDFKRPHWNVDNGFAGALSMMNKDDGPIYKKFKDSLEWLSTLKKDKDSYGLIHADVHQGNFFVDEDQSLTLFDFDDSQYHWFVYDIAVPIAAMYSLKDFDAKTAGEILIKGYLSINSLSDEWVMRIPDFICFRAALLFHWAKANLKNGSFNPADLEKINTFIESSKTLALREL